MTDFLPLEKLSRQIESMPMQNHIEILKILSKYKSITLNENKNGVLVNLTDVSSLVIDEISAYVKYVEIQEKNLNEVELKKATFKNTYFSKDNKEMPSYSTYA
jgi:hypothetical protein